MRILIILIFMLFSVVNAQEFTVSTIVSMPGKISNYDFADYITQSNENIAFLCFEHYNDSVYSIILKQINPVDGDYITIVSDTTPQINPTISFMKDYNPLIVWQCKKDNHWRLASRTYSMDTLSSIAFLTDSVSNNVNPSLAFGKLCWIENGYLKIATMNDTLTDIMNIDSNNCLNPDFFYHSDATLGYILYEKNIDSNKVIRNFSYYKDNWMYSTLSDTGRNCYPRYGHDLEISYQKFLNGVWKAVLPDKNWISSNKSYNIENPIYFSFLIVGKDESSPSGDPFIVYESDSLQNNKEIYLELFVPDSDKQALNLSNLPGDDTFPYSTLIGDSINIFWINSNNDFAQIMCAKAHFNPDVNTIPSDGTYSIDYALSQNYPNPFNSSTTIQFTLPKSEFVILKIYNILGQEIAELVSKRLDMGIHKYEWDASEYASGLYFYKLSASGIYYYVLDVGPGKFYNVKKMVLIR